MNKTTLLDHIDPENRIPLARLLDRAEQAERRNIPSSSDFLTPSQQMQALDLLHQAEIPEESYLRTGGYDGAERQIFCFLPDWMEPDLCEMPIRCLRCSYRAADHLSHRDLLGSLMGLGIVREKVGDILVTEESCDVLVLDSVAEFLLQNWTGAGRAHLSVQEVDLAHIHIPKAHYEELHDTVSTLRLDAVVASGLKMARGKASALIGSGAVQVNWKNCTKSDHLLEEGDTVSARGFGKFTLKQVGGYTKKGRTAITIQRYI